MTFGKPRSFPTRSRQAATFSPLSETLRGLAVRGVSRVLVIPISFVTDHVETLAGIDIEARALARHLGIAQFELMPVLNDSATFIRALADLVLAQLRAD